MKYTITLTLGFILTLALGVLLWPTLGSQAQAQSGCKSFEAIAQASLPSSTPFAPTDSWGGPIWALLGGEFLGAPPAPLTNAFSGNDGDTIWRKNMGTGKNGSYTVGFNCAATIPNNDPTVPFTAYYTCADTFTYQVPRAVFPVPPGKGGIMQYSGNTAKIVAGTGRFTGASGNLNVHGPAMAWADNTVWWGVYGRWNAEMSGNICGIQ